MVDSHLYTKILCNVPKLMEHTKECSINKNTDQWANSSAPEFVAEVFDALVGAVFFDSNFSLKIVWDVIYPLLRSYIGMLI
jgi:dsRNA-specific ribonuclease